MQVESISGSIWKSALAGALGGIAGALAMNQFQALVGKAQQQLTDGKARAGETGGDDATVKTANAISKAVAQRELTGQEKEWAGPAVHYATGALLGATYGVLAETLPMTVVAYGVVYGTLVWLLADEIAVPIFGLSQSSFKTPLSGHAEALASHLLYSATTDLTRRGLLSL